MGVLAFCERQQMVVFFPGKQQYSSILAEHSKFISLCLAVVTVLCSKGSSQLSPSLPKPQTWQRLCYTEQQVALPLNLTHAVIYCIAVHCYASTADFPTASTAFPDSDPS